MSPVLKHKSPLTICADWSSPKGLTCCSERPIQKSHEGSYFRGNSPSWRNGPERHAKQAPPGSFSWDSPWPYPTNQLSESTVSKGVKAYALATSVRLSFARHQIMQMQIGLVNLLVASSPLLKEGLVTTVLRVGGFNSKFVSKTLCILSNLDYAIVYGHPRGWFNIYGGPECHPKLTVNTWQLTVDTWQLTVGSSWPLN